VRVGVLLALGQVGDEGRDVLFQFGQVHSDVVLIELSVVVVLLVAGDGELEAGIVELGDHGPDIVPNADHLVLDAADLALLSGNTVIASVDLFLEVLHGLPLLLGGHGVHLSVSLELGIDAIVLLLNHVDFRVQHVHVIEEGDVLFLSLDEGGDDLVNRGNTSGLLDLVEGVLNDLYVTDVHVH